MKIVRFVDVGGAVHWGTEVRIANGEPQMANGESRNAKRWALPLVGNLFDVHSVADEPLEVKRRLAPVDPPNILAIGRNYRAHAEEMATGETMQGEGRNANGGDARPDGLKPAAFREAPEVLAEPLVFLKATTSVIGPHDAIVLPRSAPNEVDYEAELAVVIGKTAKDVSEERASEYVFGYTCANDVTARDCQKRRDKQWARAKSFDTFCPLGPVVVTADELEKADTLTDQGAPELPRGGLSTETRLEQCKNSPAKARGSWGPLGGHGVRIRSTLNGQIMQEANTADMVFSVPALVSYLSRQFTLPPGTVILTGTPPGVGFARSPQVFLRAGDTISVEIDGIGRLTNRVVNSE